jgi:hypothetical protein
VQHDRGRDWKFDQQAWKSKETADGAGDRSSGAMGAFVFPCRQPGAMHLDSDTQALAKSFINAPVYR